MTHENYDRVAPQVLDRLCEKVSARMQEDRVRALTISVSVKSDSFQRRSRQTTLINATNRKETLLESASSLLEELCLGDQGLFRQGHGIRLIGVGGSHLTESSYEQINLFDWAKDLEKIEEEKKKARAEARSRKEIQNRKLEKMKKLDTMMRQSREKYGKDIIHKGTGSQQDDL
jgi:DNA polymerase-4